MAHPHASHRQHHVEKRRAHEMTRGYASGGSVKHSDAAEDKKLVKSMVKKVALRADGGAVKARADRPARKKGGRVKKSSTTVNVITGGASPVAGLGAAPSPMPPPPMAAAPPPMPPRPPMIAPPGAPGPGAPGLPPGPMLPPHASGGRAYKKGGRVGVNAGSPVYEEGVKAGTQVTHDKGKNDLKDMDRKRVITYASGGKVQKRAAGGPIYSDTAKKGPEFSGGAGGAEARIEKAKRAKTHYKAAP